MAELYNCNGLNISAIVAENRLKRPYITEEKKTECPFCIENTTFIEKVYIHTETEDDTIRVVNNKYPVCGDELEGFHDVVIDTAVHDKSPRQYTLNHWITLFDVLKMRYKQLKDEGMTFIQIFKNSGRSAGASIMHQHWQIIALKQTPLTMVQHYTGIATQIQDNRCPICDEKDKMLEYSVANQGRWQLVVPKVQTVTRETWIVPSTHIRTIEEWTHEDMQHMSFLMKKALDGYYNLLGDIDYNICIMSGEIDSNQPYHSIIKILPRTGNFAGFELATGCMIHVVSAKTFYEQLKNII